MHRLHSSDENFLESTSETWVKNSVNHRIDQTVEVAEPQRDAEDVLWWGTQFPAQRTHDSQDEERQPTEDESTSDNP